MTITEINFRQPKLWYNPELICYVDLVFNGVLKIKDVQLCQGARGLYICFPQRRIAEDRYYELVHPVERGFYEYLQSKIIAEYQNRAD